MRIPLLLGWLLGPAAPTGCYYAHLASGQLELLWTREPIEAVLTDSERPAEVREGLALVAPVRAFADELGLAVDGQYTRYVEWPGDRIVTTLVRTRPNSLEVVPWWFPMVGQLPYKGYFDRERAEREAERQRAKHGYDVCVSGVSAYSTLGWLDDPVTRPMLRRGPASLTETLLHELVHATVFLPGEADFNESVAQFIGQQAAIDFFERMAEGQHEASPLPSPDRVRASIADRRRIAETILDFRERVEALDGHPERARLRTQAEQLARATLASLPLVVLDAERVARAARLGDACLALRGTYLRDGPRHARVFEALGGDLPAMIDRLREWGEQARPVEAFFDVTKADSGGGDAAPGDALSAR